jgi:hypothetical protein
MKRLVLLLVLLAACHPDVPTTVPGSLTVRLAAAGANDGALVMVISGGEITSVQGAGTYEVTSFTDAAGVHVMVVGNLAGGSLVHLQVPDISRAADYLAVITQVADRNSFGLIDPSAYLLTIDEFP